MSERLQATKERTRREDAHEETTHKVGSAAVKQARRTAEEADAVREDIDKLLEENLDGDKLEDLLDAIDEILEPNAEEFVANYQQKGGE